MQIPVDLDTLENLYLNGELTGQALAAIAPIQWLVRHHPELINTREKVIAANAIEKPKTCCACIHFSSVHQCCTTRLESDGCTYVAVNHESIACKDFTTISLPNI